MIIKSMARKTPSFGQLLQYFHKDSFYRKAPIFTHNLYHTHTHEAAAAEMEHNATFLPKRSNGNYLYHECLILPINAEVSKPKQERILLDLVQQYVKLRASDLMVYGRMHFDTDHLHFHLCISANTVRGKQRRWLSKAQFGDIQRQLEQYKLEKYPELGTEKYYDLAARQQKREARDRNADSQAKLSRQEFELKRRSGKLTRKEQDRAALLDTFEQAASERELITQLRDLGFELYIRGQTEGVINLDTGRKYRLRTLGLDKSLQKTQKRIQTYTDRKAELNLHRAQETEQQRKERPDDAKDTNDRDR